MTRTPSNKNTSDYREPIFVVLEGGGARGIAHLGFLKAIEESAAPYQILGFSGTSIGAIVASLMAAGFKTDELFDSNSGRSPLLEQIHIAQPTQLFGPNGWRAIRIWERICTVLWSKVGAGLSIIILSAVSYCCSLALDISMGAAGLIVVALVSAMCWLAYLRLRRGLCSTETLSKVLNEALSRKLARNGNDLSTYRTLGVKFKDLPVPLRVIATNARTNRLEIFSEARTPNVVVAEAVAASITIPFMFSPTRVGRDFYFDGGVTSNLPTWLFDAELALDPEATIFAMTTRHPYDGDLKLEASDTTYHKLPIFTFGSYIVALGTTVRFFEKRMDRLELHGVDLDVGLTDFDISSVDAKRELSFVRDAICSQLQHRDRFGRKRIIEALRQVEALVRDALPPSDKGAVVRVQALIENEEAPIYLKMKFGVNVIGYSDVAIPVPIDGSLEGRAWSNWTAVVASWPLQTSEAARDCVRYHERMIWHARKWIACIPVSPDEKKGRVRGAYLVRIDSDAPLPAALEIESTQGVFVSAVKGVFDSIYLEIVKDVRALLNVVAA